MKKSLIKKFNNAAILYGKEQHNTQQDSVSITKRSTLKKDDIVYDICKFESKTKEVFGPILIPDQFDLQGDIISVEEIKKAIHRYMIKLTFRDDPEFLKSLGLNNKAERGFMHEEFDRRFAFVEIYTAPVDMEVNNRKIKRGTALGVAKVFDPEMISLIEAGRITGFSIGGQSKVIPLGS